MKKIKLYGKLGKEFGRTHYYNVKNAAEAVRALCVNYPAFQNMLYNEKQLGYRVLTDNVEKGVDELFYPAEKEIKIIPVVVGSNNEAKIIIGAILVASAYYFNPVLGETLRNILFTAGVNLILVGTIGMLTPVPDAPESPEKVESFGFNGPVNNIRQGGPVPLAYGELIVGSHVISAGISTEEQPI